jgi:hypothetical protein
MSIFSQNRSRAKMLVEPRKLNMKLYACVDKPAGLAGKLKLPLAIAITFENEYLKEDYHEMGS